jgi:hypothetical protein
MPGGPPPGAPPVPFPFEYSYGQGHPFGYPMGFPYAYNSHALGWLYNAPDTVVRFGCVDGLCGFGGNARFPSLWGAVHGLPTPWHSTGDMPPHYGYIAYPKNFYYFRPYNWFQIPLHQREVTVYGGDPRHPYANHVFAKVYSDLEAEWGVAEEVPGPVEAPPANGEAAPKPPEAEDTAPAPRGAAPAPEGAGPAPNPRDKPSTSGQTINNRNNKVRTPALRPQMRIRRPTTET